VVEVFAVVLLLPYPFIAKIEEEEGKGKNCMLLLQNNIASEYLSLEAARRKKRGEGTYLYRAGWSTSDDGGSQKSDAEKGKEGEGCEPPRRLDLSSHNN